MKAQQIYTGESLRFSTIEGFYAMARPLLDEFYIWEMKHSIVDAAADHLCYKCGSHREFDRICSLFGRESILHESIVSGRRMAIIKLQTPMQSLLCGDISLLELFDQKPDGTQKASFNHIEIRPKTGTLQGLARRCRQLGMTVHETKRERGKTYHVDIEGGFKVHFEWDSILARVKTEKIRSV